jgi:hypothetical protein
MNWLEDHIENFVKPQVGDFDETPLGFFEPEELTVIKNTWRSIKAQAKANGSKQILLPGRDVFVFEILARRENYPTIFMPECSRVTVRKIAPGYARDKKNVYLFDTGFAGSIPRNLGTPNFGLLSHAERNSTKQIFPRLTFSRGLALKIEQTPKYWESGRIDSFGEVLQPWSTREVFIQAARLTIEIYKSSSPKFIKKPRPIDTRKGLQGAAQMVTHW